MDADEIFDSCVRSVGDLAGVFEYDGETGFFYLYKTHAGQGSSVLASIPIFSGVADFAQTDVAIRWNVEEDKVGLFIREELWAVFDVNRNNEHGGHYKRDAAPDLPMEIQRSFSLIS